MIRLKTAQGAAWRGLYLYWGQKQLGRIVLDPNNPTGRRPTLDVAFPIGLRRSCAGLLFPRLFQLRIPMPYVRWKYPCGRVRMALYKLSSKFWCGMDGRYGWFGSVRRQRAKLEEICGEEVE